jgi:molybdenum cofactor synthesis domain-containing protein
MKQIRIEDAVGMALGHDVTQIIPGKFKGPRFRRGHLIREEDIPEFLKIGKEHVYVMELEVGTIHEDDAAVRLGRAFAGRSINIEGPSEGKVSFHSKINGILKINLPLLNRINLSRNVILSTLHRHTPCVPGMAVGATRIISLTAPEKQIEKVESWCRKNGSVIEILPYRTMNISVVVTGSEFFHGRTEDRFDARVGKKIAHFGSRVLKKRVVPDDIYQISKAVSELNGDEVDLILVTGGLSVDPDDVTRKGIQKAGTKIIFYGTPVLRGAMFLYGMLGDKPILGLPACVFHHNATLFDLIFPRILAGDTLTRREINLLGHGGFCLNCVSCHFPVCPFGKG